MQSSRLLWHETELLISQYNLNISTPPHTLLSFKSWSIHQGVAAHKTWSNHEGIDAHKTTSHTTPLQELLYYASQKSPLGIPRVAATDDAMSKSGAVSVSAVEVSSCPDIAATKLHMGL